MGIVAATMGKIADGLIIGIIDLVMGIPHILLLVLISFALGKGFWGVVAGISLTHWTSLARLIRGEVLQLKQSQYIKIAEKLGQGKLSIAFRHMTPHLIPQLFVGLVLMFPHAILHEASVTFLGFGLSPEQPAIGVILSEKHEISRYGKMVAGPVSGTLSCLCGTFVPFYGKHHKPAFWIRPMRISEKPHENRSKG